MGSGAPIRSSSRVRGESGPRPTPSVTRSSDNVNLDGTPNKKSPLGSSIAVGGGVKSGLEADEIDADADADAEADAELELEAEAEILGAVGATTRPKTAEESPGGDDSEGEVDADADADAELLETVEAAEANSSSSHGGEHMRMKSESWCWKVVGLLARWSSGCWLPPSDLRLWAAAIARHVRVLRLVINFSRRLL